MPPPLSFGKKKKDLSSNLHCMLLGDAIDMNNSVI